MQTGSLLGITLIDLSIEEGELDRFTDTGIHLRDGRWFDWHAVASLWVIE